MNRRQFIGGAVAVLAAPSLPVPQPAVHPIWGVAPATWEDVIRESHAKLYEGWSARLNGHEPPTLINADLPPARQ